MGSSFVNLKWQLLIAVAVAAGVSPACAQRVARSGQPILMSAPENDAVLTNAPSLTPKAPDLPDFSETIHAPGLDFNAPVDTTPLSAPTLPAISPAEVARLQALRAKSRNWTMQTPAEIMDVPTPEKILGLTESDASGMPQKKSPVERFYTRQERLQNSRTNAFPSNVSQRGPDFSGNQELQWNPNFLNSPNASPGTPAEVNPFIGNATPNQNPGAGWLQSPALKTSAPTPNQPAAMDQFRQLLELRSPAPSAVRTAASGKNVPAPQTTPDSLFGKSPVNLISTPSAPLVTGIGVPAGVAPLPGILGQTNAVSATSPSWKPDLPPWMSSAPRLGEIPQRKF